MDSTDSTNKLTLHSLLESDFADKRKKLFLKHFQKTLQNQEGRIGYILAWLLGIPIPILLLVYFLRGCH